MPSCVWRYDGRSRYYPLHYNFTHCNPLQVQANGDAVVIQWLIETAPMSYVWPLVKRPPFDRLMLKDFVRAIFHAIWNLKYLLWSPWCMNSANIFAIFKIQLGEVEKSVILRCPFTCRSCPNWACLPRKPDKWCNVYYAWRNIVYNFGLINNLSLIPMFQLFWDFQTTWFWKAFS